MNISREQFVEAMDVIWSEIEYQNNLERRTSDEAINAPAFLSLARVYMRRAEEAWAMNPSPCVETQDNMRKIAAILTRALIVTGSLTPRSVATAE